MQRTCGFVSHRRQTAGRCYTVTMGAWETNALGYNSASTYAQSHVNDTSTQAGTAANSAAAAKKAKYTDIANTHIFIPVAIETGGPWNVEAIEFIQEIGRRITLINGEYRETEYRFQRISIAIQKGNHLAYDSTFQTEPNF